MFQVFTKSAINKFSLFSCSSLSLYTKTVDHCISQVDKDVLNYVFGAERNTSTLQSYRRRISFIWKTTIKYYPN